MKLKLRDSMCPQQNCTALIKEMSMCISLSGTLIITVECEKGHKTDLHYEKSAAWKEKEDGKTQ